MFQIFFVLLIFLVCCVLMDSQIRVHLVTLRGLEGDAEREGSLVFSRGSGPCRRWGVLGELLENGCQRGARRAGC